VLAAVQRIGSGEYFRCRYGFASMNNPTGGLKDEEQCQTWCYVREDSTAQSQCTVAPHTITQSS